MTLVFARVVLLSPSVEIWNILSEIKKIYKEKNKSIPH